jgi:hypothetical protein
MSEQLSDTAEMVNELNGYNQPMRDELFLAATAMAGLTDRESTHVRFREWIKRMIAAGVDPTAVGVAIGAFTTATESDVCTPGRHPKRVGVRPGFANISVAVSDDLHVTFHDGGAQQ